MDSLHKSWTATISMFGRGFPTAGSADPVSHVASWGGTRHGHEVTQIRHTAAELWVMSAKGTDRAQVAARLRETQNSWMTTPRIRRQGRQWGEKVIEQRFMRPKSAVDSQIASSGES